MARTTIRTEDITADAVTAPKIASGAVPEYDDSGIQDDIALIGFKVAANGSLAKYNLVDQTVDDFQDGSGIDASASTGETRDASGKYYSGTGAVTATGGTITTDGDYTIHSFTAVGSTNYVTDTAQTIDYLLVGGGGGGAGSQVQNPGNHQHGSGGGGGGGMRYLTGVSLAAGTFAVVVGDGGGGGPATNGTQGGDGGDSSFNSQTATGGGGGGSSGIGGRSGGSGGGAGPNAHSGGAGNTPSTSPSQGFAGGTTSGSGGSGAGGGGAGEAGNNNSSGSGVDGGDGLANSITGSSVTYAGGGGSGGKLGDANGSGGAGGGGNAGSTGTDGLGGGGGACDGGSGQGGSQVDGGSGIVIIRRPTAGPNVDMTLVSNSTTAEATPTKGDIVMTYTNGAGTATLNTDLKAYVSRDNGTTYTQGTLALQGTTGGHTVVTLHDLDISSQPSGTSMRYKIETLNQGASKETRVHAVSLGWS